MPDDSAPEALIAGCGTGSHSILTAQRFRGIRVLAIDLSLSSISYAKRKTQELGMTNIEYAQADILKLGDIARTFDIIESVGCCIIWPTPSPDGEPCCLDCGPEDSWLWASTANLRAGTWSRRVNSLPHAVMQARPMTFVGSARISPSGTRALSCNGLSKIPDFFSTSECRDLLFHVQEHRLTLGQIESFLAEFGLHFIGFELDRSVLHQYRARFTDDPSGTNLRNWARFEADNPDTFTGMYRFWIQKPISH